VYVLALASAVRILRAGVRIAAAVSLGLVALVALFSSIFLLVPAAAALASVILRRQGARRKGGYLSVTSTRA
jgi:hypothetical protein